MHLGTAAALSLNLCLGRGQMHSNQEPSGMVVNGIQGEGRLARCGKLETIRRRVRAPVQPRHRRGAPREARRSASARRGSEAASHAWAHHTGGHHRGRTRLHHARRLHETAAHLGAAHLRSHRRIADGQVAQAGHHGDRGHVVRHEVVRGALLLLLLLLLLLRLLVERVHPAGVLAEHLDQERHGVIRHSVAPGELQADVRADQVVASVQARREAFFHAVVDEETQQALRQLGVAAVECSLHRVTVHLVVLREVDRLLVTLVLLVHQRRDPSHLGELVLFEPLREGDLVEVVELRDGLAQLLVLLALDEDLVDGFVHGCDVVRLGLLHVRHDQRQMAGLLHLLHDTCVVNLGNDGVQQGIELHWVFLQIKVDGAVIYLQVRDLLEDHQKLVMGECHRAVRHHGVRRLVELVVVGVKEHGVLPMVVALASLNELRDVKLVRVQLYEVH
mmetsp:Transcript_88550/g.255403  ORF Transcript_88550/g.255403 Transcript_88550/m.255403 type:complete len:447 (-) Transcript_88550:856-2196(-)